MKVVKCFECGYQIQADDALEYEGELYCDDCASTCDDCGEVHLRDSMTYVESDESLVCQDCLDENYFYCERCESYQSGFSTYIDSLDGYVCDDCLDSYVSCAECGYSAHIDNMYRHNDEYYCEDCLPDEEENTFRYHSGEGRGFKSGDYRYRIGIELEREDYDFKSNLEPYSFLDRTGWAIEDDSSLDYSSGFEAVSPVYALRITELERAFRKGTELNALINAEFTSNCGGHMTISDTKRTPNDIIDDIAGYLPMLYALFPNRAYSHWCRATEKDNYKRGGRNALHKRGNCNGEGLEIRLFDAPRDEHDLLNRIRLLKYMLQHKATTTEQGIKELSESSKLREIVRKHLNRYNINYKDFYSNIVKFARELERERVGIRKVNNILEK